MFPGTPCNMPKTSDAATKPEHGSLVSLHYVANSNICLHYENNPFLKDSVFPDTDLLADLFRPLFHRNIAEVINFEV